MRKIFIIGATGKVGGAAIEHLIAKEEMGIVAGVRDLEAAQMRFPSQVELRQFDLDDTKTIAPALSGVDSLLLLTGYTVDMLKQSKRVIDAAVIAGVKHIVHVGASGNETSEVAHWGWHRMIEAYIAQSGLGYTFLHPEAFMQNITAFGWYDGQNLTNLIGDAVWSWVDARDVGTLAAEALMRPTDFSGQTWRLGYEAASMADVAARISNKTGSAIGLSPMDPHKFYEAAVAAGADPAYIACIRDQFVLCAEGALEGIETVFDATDFESAVGRPPATWESYLESAL